MQFNLKVKEQSIESELKARVEARGGLCTKVKALGTRGYFDRIVVLPGGRVFFVELKRPKGGRISPHQKARHLSYRRLGVAVAIIKNQADIDALLSDP